MEYTTNNEIKELQIIRERIHRLGIQQQREAIRKASPYSDRITAHIRTYDELRFYCSLNLQECAVTRPALVKTVDPSLWISSEGCTNLDLMQKGNAPYSFDAPEGKIELHHIGQAYTAPFAELTVEEHQSNGHLLHFSYEQSWRNNESLERSFYTERTIYWKNRVNQETVIADFKFDTPKYDPVRKSQEYCAELRKVCEEIYEQCPPDDLEYLSDLANSYALMQRVGATTMREFLQNSRDAFQTDVSCPACKSGDYVLFGTYQGPGEKVQRYKCKSCGKVFAPLNRSLVSGSAFSYRDWIKFIDCLYNGYTVKQIAHACDISERTAHNNRIKLFYALKLLNDRVALQGNIVLDETYVPVSFKGNHSKDDDFVMPRSSYKRGGENHAKGITDNLACIVCAVDDSGNSVAKVAGTGNVSAAKLKYVLKEHLGDNIFCLYSDKSNAIKSFAESNGYEIKQEKLLRKGAKRTTGIVFNRDTFVINRYLQIINSYHSRLKKFLTRFSGISTKYLSGYLYLFAWKERNKDREPVEAYKELLYILTEPNNYQTVTDILNNGYLPDAIKINETYRKTPFPNLERDLAIYERYANGETMVSIAADYGWTKQYVSQIIQALRQHGYALKTKKDIEHRQIRRSTPQSHLTKSALGNMIRDYQIYSAKIEWTGSAAEFEQAMAAKYGLSQSSIKNVISRMKRILRLKEEVYIYENVSYRSLEDVYRRVYSEYLHMQAENPNTSTNSCVETIAANHGFSPQNIYRIIHIMSTENATEYFKRKRKLSPAEVYNRDRAIFIDYLRWPGERTDFCRHAAEKYNLSYNYVYAILKYCLYADPQRFNMV